MNFNKIIKLTGVIAGIMMGCQSSNVSALEVVLAWDASTNNIDGTALAGLTGYKLYYGASSRNYSAILDVGNTNFFKVTGLLQGSTYYFAVTACVSNDSQSEYSSELAWTASDTTPPTISTVSSVTLNADASGMAAVPNFVQNATVTDNCSLPANIALSQTLSAGTLIGAGVTSVILTATDEAGNSAQTSVLVTVTVPPPVVVEPPVVVNILPSPWNTQDIGTGIASGSASFSNSVYTVSGAGNISGTADKFRFVYQVLSGNGEVKARVASLQNAGTMAKAGIMIRESLTSGSRQTSLSLLASGKLEFLRRTSTGGSVKTTVSTGNVAPNNWIRLVRKSSTITAYKSANGTTWTSIGSQYLSMASTISFGLVTASGNTNTLSTAIIDNVTVVP